MKFIKADLPTTHNSIEIILFFDTHIGSEKCDEKLILSQIKYVEEHDNAYAILGGDIINNSTINSVAGASVYTEPLSPMQQLKKACDIFRPIKDKIIGVTSGNHERRSYKNDGIDLMQFFCAELGITDKYDYTSCLLFIRFGEARWRGRPILYTLFMSHGDGIGGGTVGAKANGLKKRGDIIDADIVVTGHTHQALTFRQCMYRIDPRNNVAQLKEQVFVNAGSPLDWEQYAEQIGMRPSSKNNPKILLSSMEHKIIVIS